jgi:hypothetical protein
MANNSGSDNNGSDSKRSPNNSPEPDKNPISTGDSSKERKKKSPELRKFEKNYDSFDEAYTRTTIYKSDNDKKHNLPLILEKYKDYLSQEDKQKLDTFIHHPFKPKVTEKTTVKEFLLSKQRQQKDALNSAKDIVNLFNQNSKNIKQTHLKGKKSLESKEFSKQLEIFYQQTVNEYNCNKSLIESQLPISEEFEEQLRIGNCSVFKMTIGYKNICTASK